MPLWNVWYNFTTHNQKVTFSQRNHTAFKTVSGEPSLVCLELIKSMYYVKFHLPIDFSKSNLVTFL